MSPAIDAGIAAGAPMVDIEGNPRIGEVDAGAYEFDPSTGLADILADHSTLTILPNPVAEHLRFELDNDFRGNVKMTVINSAGQLIQQWSTAKGEDVLQQNVAVKSLPQGAYLLFAQYEHFVVRQQFIKL